MNIVSAEYVTSAFDRSQFPKDRLPEIAFAGRSNVGKSSLLNCLIGRQLAKTSRTPGKTRAINFFLINRQFYFVDLPGYGYARVPKSVQQSWERLMEGYFRRRPNLRATVVIIDIRREEIPASDLQMMEYLVSADIPCLPVFTKLDKLSRSELARAKRAHARQLPSGSLPALFSAVTREGVPELKRRISAYLA